MRVAVFEPEADGHHLALYTRNILREMMRRGWNAHLVTTDRAMRHPAWQMLAPEIEGKVTVTTMPDQETPSSAGDLQRLKDQFQRLKNYGIGYREALKHGPLDAVFMVNLDQADLPMSVKGSPFGRTPFAGILIGRHFHCPEVGVKMGGLKLRDKIMGPVFRRILKIRTLKALLAVDETLPEWAHKAKPRGFEKVQYLPDVASFRLHEDSVMARKELGIPEDRFLVLAYGALSERKGVADLLAGAAHPSTPIHAALLYAGRQDEFTQETLRSESAQNLRGAGRLFELSGFLDDHQESLVLSACDAVWLGYRHWFGASGVLLQAAAAGKPVIAMDEGLVEWLVKKHQIGLTVPIRDSLAVSEAITRLASDPTTRAAYEGNGLALAARHTPELFGKNVCCVIERIAGQFEPAT